MDLGMIGLGRMGSGMARRWLRAGHQVVGYDSSPEPVQSLTNEGGTGVPSISALVQALVPPRAIWIMLPAGEVTEHVIAALAVHLTPGDTIIDGGNTHFHDDLRRAPVLQAHGINYVDQGTSGGIWGLEQGYCLMVGGETDIIARLQPAFRALAPRDGYAHVGPVGAGHFVKMIHNGIEYGMMQAYAEGFAVLQANRQFDLDVHQIAQIWNHGSVVRSWLLELITHALSSDPQLTRIRGYVPDSGEGRWTVQAAIDADIPAPVLTLALFERFHSRQPESFAAKVLAAMRAEFGGHAVVPAE